MEIQEEEKEGERKYALIIAFLYSTLAFRVQRGRVAFFINLPSGKQLGVVRCGAVSGGVVMVAVVMTKLGQWKLVEAKDDRSVVVGPIAVPECCRMNLSQLL